MSDRTSFEIRTNLMKMDRIAFLMVASIIPVGTVSPKALVLMLGLAVMVLLSFNRDGLGYIMRRGGQYFVYFVPLLLVGLASSLWSLEMALSLGLALKLIVLAAIGCVAMAAVTELPSGTSDILKQAIHLGVVLAGALLLFEAATSGWVYRTTRGYAWEQVIFEPTGGINLDTPIKSGITVMSIFVWCLFVNTRRGMLLGVTVFALVLVLAWMFSATASLVALSLGLVVALMARLAFRPVLIFTAITFFLALMASPFVAHVALRDVTPSTVNAQVGDSALPLSGMNRMITWRFTSEKIMEKPLLGWGLRTSRILPGGGEKYNIVRIRENGSRQVMSRDFFIPLHPHNQFLQIWLELGALGAIAFALVGAIFILRIGRLPMQKSRSEWMIGAIVTLIVYGQISFGAWQNWWIAGQFLSVGLLLVTLSAESANRKPDQTKV